MLFFIAIIQYHVLRIPNFIIRYDRTLKLYDYTWLRTVATVVAFASEIIMIFCLCLSINKALNTFKEQSKELSKQLYTH